MVLKKEKTTELPVWAVSLIDKYESSISHTFILHNAVGDYPAGIPGANLRNYLMSDLTRELGFSKAHDIILYWDRRGFSFLTEAMKLRFGIATGLTSAGASGKSATTRASLMAAAAGMARDTSLDGQLEEQGRTPTSAFRLIDRVLRLTEEDAKRLFPPETGKQDRWHPFRVAVVLGYGESQAPASNDKPSETDRTSYVTLSEWAKDFFVGDRGHLLLMCVDELQEMDDRLRRSSARWEQIEVPYPNVEQRCDFIKEIIRVSEMESREDSTLSPIQLAEGFTEQDFARAAAGLPYTGLHDIALRARLKGIPIDPILVGERRAEMIASEYSDVLVLGESSMTFEDLGGLDIVKSFLLEEVIAPLRSGDRRRVPQGILFTGPAGVGKSEVARVLAHEAKVLFVEVQLNKLLNMFVGNSERNLERVLSGITIFAPCIAFIDEIDKVIRRGNGGEGDSGVGARMKKRLMEFMADPKWKGLIVWIGATNEPYDLDAALTRPGRFDIKLPFVVPDAKGIAEILEKRVKRAFSDVPTNALPEPEFYVALAEQMDGYRTGVYYTGAEITFMVGKAFSLYCKSARKWSVTKALEEAHLRTLPTTQEIERMQDDAIALTSDLDLIPRHLWERAKALRIQQKLEQVPVESTPESEEEDRTDARGIRRRRGRTS